MVYLFGGLVGVVWLWFWLRGHWFAALLAALVLGSALVVLPSPGNHPVWWMTLVCLLGPWVPMAAWRIIGHQAGQNRESFSLTLR